MEALQASLEYRLAQAELNKMIGLLATSKNWESIYMLDLIVVLTVLWVVFAAIALFTLKKF